MYRRYGTKLGTIPDPLTATEIGFQATVQKKPNNAKTAAGRYRTVPKHSAWELT